MTDTEERVRLHYDHTGRTPQDYAIEHASYLADAAREMLKAVDALAQAELDREESDTDQSHDGVAEAREAVSEHRRALHSTIYEFEKRRDRAVASGVVEVPKC